MKLIDDEKKATPRANEWRNDAKYSEVCQEIVKEVYPSELLDLFPGPDFDKIAIKEWFKHDGGLGEGAATQNAAMYILLKSGILKGEEDVPKRVKEKRKETAKTEKGPSKLEKESIIEHKERGNSEISQPTIHIDLQIHISPEANQSQIESIFENMAKYLLKNR